MALNLGGGDVAAPFDLMRRRGNRGGRGRVGATYVSFLQRQSYSNET